MEKGSGSRVCDRGVPPAMLRCSSKHLHRSQLAPQKAYSPSHTAGGSAWRAGPFLDSKGKDGHGLGRGTGGPCCWQVAGDTAVGGLPGKSPWCGGTGRPATQTGQLPPLPRVRFLHRCQGARAEHGLVGFSPHCGFPPCLAQPCHRAGPCPCPPACPWQPLQPQDHCGQAGFHAVSRD